MKIIMKGNVRNVSTDVGETMIAAGLARELTPRDEANAAMSFHPSHSLNWFVMPRLLNDPQGPPALGYRCTCCARTEIQQPRSLEKRKVPNKPPEDAIKLRVPCGLTKNDAGVYVCDWHECPREIAAQYFDLFKKWKGGGEGKDEAYQALVDSMIRKDPRKAYLKAGGVVTL